MRSKIATIMIMSLVSVSCYEEHNQIRTQKNQEKTTTKEILNIKYPDGKDGYKVIIESEKNKIPKKVGIFEGKRMSPIKAQNLYTEKYSIKWGKNTTSLVQKYNSSIDKGEIIDAFVISKEKLSDLYENPFKAYDDRYIYILNGTLEEIYSLGFDDRIVQVSYKEKKSNGEDNSSVDCTILPNFEGGTSSRSSLSDISFNNYGNYAQNIKIGVQESIVNQCGILDTHVDFKNMQINYKNTDIKSCIINSDCDTCCNNNNCTAQCNFGFCATKHTTATVGRIGHVDKYGEIRHAGKAKIYIDNVNSIQTLQDHELDLKYLNEEANVDIINQSFNPNSSADLYFKWLNNFYTRSQKITFVKATGNLRYLESNHCPLDSICVGNVISNDYDSFLDDKISDKTRYLNINGVDAEFPDIVAEGDNGNVSAYDAYDQWICSEGTSAAAPTVTGAVALLYKKCKDYNPGLFNRNSSNPHNVPIALRSRLKTSSYSPQNLEDDINAPFYPTTDYDSKAGAGILNAKNMNIYCQDSVNTGESEPGSPAAFAYDEVTKLDEGWSPIPSDWLSGSTESSTTTTGDVINQYLLSPGYETKEHASYNKLKAGSRFRATLSFLTCSKEGFVEFPNNQTYGTPKIDFDLALIDGANGNLHGISQSLHDTDEGFDIIARSDIEKPQLMLIKPGGETEGCEGPFEPTSVSVAIWSK